MAPTSRAVRRALIGVAVVTAVVLITGAAVAIRADDGGSGQPNIVVIMTDDQTAESLRVMPNVAELIGAEGVTFTDSVVSYALCCPSRATYLTGQYAHNHGVFANSPPSGGFAGFEHQDTTFPVALQDAGYDTVHVGKYLNGYGKEPPVEAPPGWTEWLGSIDPTSYRYTGFTLLEDGEPRVYDDGEYQTDVYTDLATEVIRERSGDGTPFFLDVAYLAPHNEVTEDAAPEDGVPGRAVPAPRHLGAFEDESLAYSPAFNEADVTDKPMRIQAFPRLTEEDTAEMTQSYQRYLESLLAVDEGVGRIIGALEETGVLDDTVVIFTSDNGFFFGEHRIPEGKILFYEPSIRVPLLVRGPGIPRNQTRQGLVANIDLAPTILDLADATPLRTVDGRSLLESIGDETAPERTVLLEAGGALDPENKSFGVRTSRYVLMELSNGRQELYDLATDPAQLESRDDDPELAAVRKELDSQLAALKACAGQTCDVG